MPGLPAAAAKEGLTPLEYMRKHGAFLVEDGVYRTHETSLAPAALEGSAVDRADGSHHEGGAAVGVVVDGQRVVGFPTPSRKLEFYSKTLGDWGWPEYALPGLHREPRALAEIDRARRASSSSLPTFRLPTLIHTRSGNAKWLYEISNTNPLWIHPRTPRASASRPATSSQVDTAIGYFVDKVWVTEAIRPGIVACSHHLGRWRLSEEQGGERWSTALVRPRAAAARPVADAAGPRDPSRSRATTPTPSACAGRTAASTRT